VVGLVGRIGLARLVSVLTKDLVVKRDWHDLCGHFGQLLGLWRDRQSRLAVGGIHLVVVLHGVRVVHGARVDVEGGGDRVHGVLGEAGAEFFGEGLGVGGSVLGQGVGEGTCHK